MQAFGMRRRLVRLFVLGLLVALAGGLMTPVGATPAHGASAIQQISGGGSHTCARTTGGTVWCWGSNSVGQIGDGTSGGRRSPVPVVGLDRPRFIASGAAHTCAIDRSGQVQCWGSNVLGALGDGTTTDRSVPTEVEGLGGTAVAVTAGTFNTCAVLTDGAVKCWGRNSYGEVGAPSRDECVILPDYPEPCSLTPVEISELRGMVTDIDASSSHTCAVTTAGGVKCWGYNGSLALGVPTSELCSPHGYDTPCSTVPVDACQTYDEGAQECVEPLSGVSAVSAGSSHTCAAATGGTVKCWGAFWGGRLGDGGACYEFCPPVDVCADYDTEELKCHELLTDIADVQAGDGHSCALGLAGAVWCWGDNYPGGLLGDNDACGYDCPTPVSVCAGETCAAPLAGATAISAGYFHACAIQMGGKVSCWGQNVYGQLGSNCCFSQNTPEEVEFGENPHGDVDCDGTLTSIDAALILQYEAGVSYSLECVLLADVDLDSHVDSVDALIVLQYIAGPISGP